MLIADEPQIKTVPTETTASVDVEETTLFQNGRSQAMRIPAKFRLKGDKVYVRRDRLTGDLIVSQRRNDWADLIAEIENDPFPEDFLADRDQGFLQEREPL